MSRLAFAVSFIAMLCALVPARAQQAPDPRGEIRSAVKLAPPASLDHADVSEVRGTQGPQLGDAMACLRLSGGASGYVAVFFEGGIVIDYRRAVALDRCEALAYAPLPAPAAPAGKKRPPQRS